MPVQRRPESTGPNRTTVPSKTASRAVASGRLTYAWRRNLNDWSWRREGIAVVVTALLVLSIRNEWDLITWIAPRPDGGSDEPGYESVS